MDEAIRREAENGVPMKEKRKHPGHQAEAGDGPKQREEAANEAAGADGKAAGDGEKNGLPPGEELQATVVQYLRQGGEDEEARLLELCIFEFGKTRRVGDDHFRVDITLRCNRNVLARLTSMTVFQEEPEVMRRVRYAVRASLPGEFQAGVVEARATAVRPNGAKGNGNGGTEETGALRETEAHRVFKLLGVLRTEPKLRKAPLHTVFDFLILGGLTGQQAAQRCNCAPSLITARIKTLEDRFKMTMERLRNYATDLREFDGAVKGDRWGKKQAGKFTEGNDGNEGAEGEGNE